MSSSERPDDFETRRAKLRPLSDEELHARFWELAQRLVAPLPGGRPAARRRRVCVERRAQQVERRRAGSRSRGRRLHGEWLS